METMLDRILSLVPSTHGGKKQFCDSIGIKQQTLSDWIAGRNFSYDVYAYKIAYVYQTPVEWIITGEMPKKTTLSSEEEELIIAFRNSPWNIQQSVKLVLGIGVEKNNADTSGVSA